MKERKKFRSKWEWLYNDLDALEFADNWFVAGINAKPSIVAQAILRYCKATGKDVRYGVTKEGNYIFTRYDKEE